MEKILADYFDVNLGSIDVLDSDKHKFKLEDWQNDDWNVVIYSKEEYEVILYNVIEHLYEELSKKEIDLIDGISIQMSKLINENIFENKMSDILIGDKLNKLISNCLGEDWSFKEKVKDYFIWIS